jgi:hypothetical protein
MALIRSSYKSSSFGYSICPGNDPPIDINLLAST